MRRRHASPVTAATLLVAAVVAGCGAVAEPTESSAPRATAGTTPRPTAASPSPTLPVTNVDEPAPSEPLTEEFPRDAFADPTTIDNRYFPLLPGTRWRWEGEVTVDGRRVDHSVVFSVTDLTKVVDGVEVVVTVDEDYVGGELVELELAFFAQADDGTVWHVGEYPEEYERGQLVGTPSWIAGQRGALAGIMMRAVPRYGDRSYSEGWGPEVGWTDRGRVFETGSRTCVPTGCYDDVLIIDEFNRDEPDAHQLKYYAPGVGGVRVGWAGALESAQETLALVEVGPLDPDALAALRRQALALEARAYENSPDVYGATSPARQTLTAAR